VGRESSGGESALARKCFNARFFPWIKRLRRRAFIDGNRGSGKLLVLRGIGQRQVRLEKAIDKLALLFLCGSCPDTGEERQNYSDRPHGAERAEGGDAL
jgi:hypothetical protein